MGSNVKKTWTFNVQNRYINKAKGLRAITIAIANLQER